MSGKPNRKSSGHASPTTSPVRSPTLSPTLSRSANSEQKKDVLPEVPTPTGTFKKGSVDLATLMKSDKEKTGNIVRSSSGEKASSFDIKPDEGRRTASSSAETKPYISDPTGCMKVSQYTLNMLPSPTPKMAKSKGSRRVRSSDSPLRAFPAPAVDENSALALEHRRDILSDFEQWQINCLYYLGLIVQRLWKILQQSEHHVLVPEMIDSLENYKRLYDLHTSVLCEMRKVMVVFPNVNLMFGKLLWNKVHDFKIYHHFHANFSKYIETYHKCMKNKHFALAVKHFEMLEDHDNLGVLGLLSVPMQNLPELLYSLGKLIQEYGKNICSSDEVEVRLLEATVAVLEENIINISRSITADASMARLMALNRSIIGLEGSIISSSRLFVKEGPLELVDEGHSKRYVFLFNDLFLETVSKADKKSDVTNRYSVTVHCHTSQIESIGVNTRNVCNLNVSMKINGKEVTRTYGAPSMEQRDSWVLAMNSIVRTHEISCKVFGVPLDLLIQREGGDIPFFLKKCLEFLRKNGGFEEEGLFRSSGSFPEVQKMKVFLDTGDNKSFEQSLSDNNVLATLITWWLLELPDPLLTFNFYEEFLSFKHLPTPEEQRHHIKATMDRLPNPHKFSASSIFRFLSELTEHADENKMTPENIAIVFSPLMMKNREGLPRIEDIKPCNTLMRMIVENCDFIFENVEMDRKNVLKENERKSEARLGDAERIATMVYGDCEGPAQTLVHYLMVSDTSRKLVPSLKDLLSTSPASPTSPLSPKSPSSPPQKHRSRKKKEKGP
eukprot:CAMPEP_0177640122 /NCGR_PEP_ID=MMETSP0447-20121125/6378_1 /TAXON_ID=0 /ORGANISM="Stygamoeba regulata, Strain BSH-02190019" /LENGTH=781 /DNA_ID=CAMNT_0019142179 /DNA_START=218 /DNA_END=2563 /DNA_ORIENTATION=+